MSIYNNNRFTPGSKSNLRKYLNSEYLKQSNNYNEYIYDEYCKCIQNTKNSYKIKEGYNDATITNNQRLSGILNRYGGKITFGNYNKPLLLNYMGGIYGQPQGTPKLLRNNF